MSPRPLFSYRDLILRDAPRAYWRLGETSGTQAVDESSGGFHGTYTGTVTKGLIGLLIRDANKAIRVANTTDSIANHVALPALGTIGNAWSLEIWARSHTDSIIFSFGLPYLMVASSLVRLSWSDAGAVQRNIDGGSAPAEAIVHVVGTHDGTTGRLYVDGVLVNSAVFSSASVGGSDGRLGVHANTSGTEGDNDLDEAAVYNYALSAGTIKEHYRAGIGEIVSAVVQQERAEFVHLLEMEFSGGIVRLNTGAQDLATEQYAVRIGADVGRYLIRNPVGTWPTTALSVEFWGRLDADADTQDANYAFSYAASSPGVDNEIVCGVEVTSGLLFQQLAIGGAFTTDTVVYPEDGAWHHLAFTWQSSDGAARLYRDGILVFSATIATGDSIVGGGALVLGQDQDTLGGGFAATQAWKGELDDVRVYRNRVLTAAEVLEHFKRKFVSETGLVARYGFDRLGDHGRDESGTGNHATVVGITTPVTGAPLVVRTWEAIGGLLEFGGVEETSDPKGQGVDVKLSGVDQTIISTLLNNNYRGQPVKIWRAWLDSVSGLVLRDLLLLFGGLQLSSYNVEESQERDGGTVTISTRLMSYLAASRARGILASLVSHQHLFPGDTFFRHVPGLANSKVYWGTKAPTQITGGGDPGGDTRDRPKFT